MIKLEYFPVVCWLSLFLLTSILSPACSIPQPGDTNDMGENCVDINMQNAIRLRRIVKEIKLDCGELCDTSIGAEKAIHKGKVQHV